MSQDNKEKINQESTNGENSNDFKNVVDILHNKENLDSLRTYHGDMAKFIKEKNESVISINIKEKKRDEIRNPSKEIIKQKSNFKENFIKLSLSLILLFSGVLVFLYIFEIMSKNNNSNVEFTKEIIPSNQSVTITNINKENFNRQLEDITLSSGTNNIKISDTNGKIIDNSTDLFDILEIKKDFSLRRILSRDFEIGALQQEKSTDYFLVIKITDFERGFASMLEWEKSIFDDLSFLKIKDFSKTLSTSSSTENYLWKDIIVKNKNTRALYLDENILMIYGFLDKNTILITTSQKSLGELSSLYLSRSVAR